MIFGPAPPHRLTRTQRVTVRVPGPDCQPECRGQNAVRGGGRRGRRREGGGGFSPARFPVTITVTVPLTPGGPADAEPESVNLKVASSSS